MAISTQTQNLNLIPGKSTPVVVHLSQGNVGNTVRFYLYDGSNPYNVPSNVSIAVHGVRADGTTFGPYKVAATTGSNLVSFDVVTAMTSINGAAIGELVITDIHKQQIGTANFGIIVEEAPYSSSPIYDDDLSIYQRILAYVQSSGAAINSKVSFLQTEIDQIVAPSGEAPSAAEIENARIGIDGTVYNTLGNAIRGQFGELEKVGEAKWTETDYNSTIEGRVVSANTRWFLNGTVVGHPRSVHVRTATTDNLIMEVWSLEGTHLRVVKTMRKAGVERGYTEFDVRDLPYGTYMFSVWSATGNNINCTINTSLGYNGLRIVNTAQFSIDISLLKPFPGLCLNAYVKYTASEVHREADELMSFSDDLNKVITHGKTAYNVNIPSGAVAAPETRWFLNGTVTGTIKKVYIKCKKANTSLVIELWAVNGTVLHRVLSKSVTSYVAYDFNEFTIDYNTDQTVMVSVTSKGEEGVLYYIVDTTAGYSARRTSDVTSTTLNMSDIPPFDGLNISGYVTYTNWSIPSSSSFMSPDITVSPDGSKRYLTIADAVAAASEGDLILVYPGTYTEPIEAFGKTLSIVGVDKKTCIIKNSTGNYETPAVEMDSGRIANFTIISDGANPTLDSSSDYYMKDYSIHIDHAHASGKTMIVENCILENNHRTALGIGLYPNNTVIIRNCDIHSGKPPADIQNPLYNKRGAVYFHNRASSEYWSNVPNQRIRIINNTIYCDDIIALFLGVIPKSDPSWVNDLEAEFINNMICAKNPDGTYKTASDGVSLAPDYNNDSAIGGMDDFTDAFRLSKTSYGNNLSHLNYSE